MAGEVDRHDVVVDGEAAGEGVERAGAEPGGVEQGEVVVAAAPLEPGEVSSAAADDEWMWGSGHQPLVRCP